MTPRPPATVRVRVTLAAVAVLTVAISLASVAVVIAQRITLTKGIEQTAQLRAQDVIATLSPDLKSITATNEDSIVQVVGPSGNVIAHSSGAGEAVRIDNDRPAVGKRTSKTIEHLAAGDNEDYRVIATTVSRPEGNYTVYVAASLESVTKSTYTLIALFFAAVPVLIAAVGTTTWVVSGRALRPVEDIRRQVQAIQSNDLHLRVPEPATSDEVGQLARTMNAMLGRLQSSSERQQRFVSDASHELRNPLTAMRTRLEVDLAYADGSDWRATAEDVLGDTLRLQRLVDDLLALARSDNRELAVRLKVLDLDEVIMEEAQALRRTSKHHIDTSAVSGGQIRGDRDLLVRAVRNVLDNANRHAATAIAISLQETADAVTLSVSDDGAGIQPEDRDRVFERFTRLDEARARDSGGAGLGLALTKEIIEAHNGRVYVEGDNGARFVMVFPAADAS